MTADSEREKIFAATMELISFLPANQRIDTLLAYFVEVMGGMDLDTVRELRDQVMDRFSTCGCSFETTRLMIDFINGHLAMRELTSQSATKRGD